MTQITQPDGVIITAPAGATIGEIQKPRVAIIGLAVDSVAKALANRVIIEVGEVLDVTVRFEMGGQLLPVNDSFAVPISKVREGVEQTKRANFVDGVATMSVTFERSGEFAVLPEWLNLHLPADQQVEFEPFYISVTG